MEEIRFDLIYDGNRLTLAPHFCRSWDIGADGVEVGCYGTNPDHGFSLGDACEQVAAWHDEQAKLWRSRQHNEVLHYLGDDPNPSSSEAEKGTER